MPTYDYECDGCGHAFELFQSISEPVKKKCPECGKSKLRRLFGTGAALVFKGSGFYQTDYRSEAYTKAAEADKKNSTGSTDSGTKSEGSSKSESSSSSKDAPSGENNRDSQSSKSKKSSEGKKRAK